jgi:hypothetical protein
MFGYLLLAFSLAAAIVLLAAGLSRSAPPRIVDDADAQTCCWAPKNGDPTRCYPCRPTRDTR